MEIVGQFSPEATLQHCCWLMCQCESLFSWQCCWASRWWKL